MNDFRNIDGNFNRKYLRVCSVYRLLKRGVIGYSRARELLAQRHTEREMQTLDATISIWKSGPFKDMEIAP